MFQPKRILITGGAGFIGSNFVRMALQDVWGPLERVVNLDKLTYAGNLSNLTDVEDSPAYRFVEGDIAKDSLVSTLLNEEKIDAVLHFAAESHVDRSIDSPEPFFQANVIGTLRLVNAARLYWKSLPENAANQFRFLHVSTDEVYGTLSPEDPAFSETTPYAPNSPYSASKAGSDFIVRAAFHTYGMPVITTNCSNNYGPYQFPEKLIPLMILNALEGKPLPIYGDGLNIRDWLYVEDHCKGIMTSLQKGRLGETYNIGGLNEQTNIAIVDQICELLDEMRPREDQKSYKDQKIFVKDRPGHDRRYAIDCSKIQGELSWQPEESFATGIRKTVSWYLENSTWCEDVTTNRYRRERLGQS